MTRITHFKQQIINVQQWDYYILCHLNTEAAITLQRMEFWDGTKENGNGHAEDINDAQVHAGYSPTQDVSHWIYKSQDELHWEMMGLIGMKKVSQVIDALLDLHYLECRNNPLKGWDRKKQYEFQPEVIQEHINYLGYVITYFALPLKRLRPVYSAIESLTKDGVYIDTLNVNKVIDKIDEMQVDPSIHHSLKEELVKFAHAFMRPHPRSFGNFAEWRKSQQAQNTTETASPFIRQFCGMHQTELRNAFRKIAEAIA